MTSPRPNPLAVLELRLRWQWRVFIGLFVPGMGFVAVAAFLSVVRREPPPDLLGLAAISALSGAILVGLVVPTAIFLVRALRGIPDARLDLQGVVWGRDRSRDLSIDWGEIGRVSVKVERTQYVTDRVFVLHPAAGRTGRAARTHFGRVLGRVNRFRYGTPFAISTVTADQPWETVRQVLVARLPEVPIELG